MKPNEIKKILIIHTWGIGDLIMFTPALRALREKLPQTQIDILITYQPVVAEVLEEGKTVNRIIKFFWKEKSFFEKLKLILKLRKEKYDWTIVTGWTNPQKGGLLSFLFGAKYRVGAYKKNKSFFYTHQVPGVDSRPRRETNLDLVRLLGIKIKGMPESFFEFGEKNEEFARDFIEKIGAKDKILIGFHPGAEPVHRYLLWPKEYFIDLGKKILQNYPETRLLVFAGPGEKDICQEIIREIKKEVFLVTDLSLKQVAALIDNCRIFVASDSGLAQIAGATRTNLITIFGPSEARLFAPPGPNVKVFSEKCRHLYDENRIHTCLKKITPDMVFEETEKILAKNNHSFYN